MASNPVELTTWWNEIEGAFERHAAVHISKRAESGVADLADSGAYLEWVVKIATGGKQQLIGHALEIDVAEESRKCSDADGIFKGRQVYARIFAYYMFGQEPRAHVT